MTTKYFFTMMTAVFTMFTTATTMAQTESAELQTKIILVTNHTDADNFSGKNAEAQSKFADILPGLFRTTHVDAIYTCASEGDVSLLQPLVSNKNMSMQTYDSGSLSKSLYDIYVSNEGKTVVICGDEKAVPQMLNMLTGTNTYGKLSKDDLYKVYMIDSNRLGTGTVKTHDLRKQI